jgi:AMP phosphorylase
MRLKIRNLEIEAGRPVAFINKEAAHKLHVHTDERVSILFERGKIVAVVDIVEDFLKSNEIFLSEDITNFLNVKPGEYVDVNLVLPSEAVHLILKKLNGNVLTKKEIYTIIQAIVNNTLDEAEIAYFVSAVYENGMSLQETIDLTEAMYKTGNVLNWHTQKIVDKHCIGGIAGNRTTPIVVSICSSAGLVMPKTSSRAITSASGTADVIETISKVDFSANELRRIVKKIGACLAWGGSLGFSPADDKLIRVERLLGVDPESQLIASILSKKLAVGSKYVLIDIPYGEGAKVSKQKALRLKKKFLTIGKHFGLKMNIILTLGDEPIGNGIGPILEMRDVLRVLKRESPPKDLENKSLFLSSLILEMTGKAKKGQGLKLAKSLLDSKKAYHQFRKIITAQGEKKVTLRPANLSFNLKSSRNGKIISIDNREINTLARILGCPVDISSGIYLHKHRYEKVNEGEIILTLFSESEQKLEEAKKYLAKNPPVKVI